jgi:hypothetical protein
MSGKLKLAALLSLIAAPACAAPMTASEIRATLIGHELCTPRSGGLISELMFCFTYKPDGTFKFAKADPGQAALWAFDKDQVCLYKATNPKERSCASFERESDKRFTVNGKDHVCIGSCED